MAPYTLLRLLRRPWQTVCAAILSGIFCFFLCFLSGYLEDQRRALHSVEDSYDILCVASDLAGTTTSSLRIGSVVTDSVRNPVYGMTDYIRNLSLTKEFSIQCDALGLEHGLLIGVTDAGCAPVLDPGLGGQIQYLDSYGRDLFADDQPVCLLSQAQYEMLGTNQFHAEIVDPCSDGSAFSVTLVVVGIYGGDDPTVYVPWPCAESWMAGMSAGVTCDSMRFYLKDNRAIQAFSALASKKFAAVDFNHESSLYDCALTIYDGPYRSAVAGITQNIRRMEILIPALLVLSLGVGFLAAFLNTKNERRTYALMRTQGVAGRQLFGSVLTEQLLPALAGTLTAIALRWQPLPAVGYLLCYTLGCGTAVLRVIRVRPLEILREQE